MVDYQISTFNDPLTRVLYMQRMQYRVKYNGTQYCLNVLAFVNDDHFYTSFKVPVYNDTQVQIFKAKCWWADGGFWWIGSYSYNPDFELIGPFNDPDEALVFLKLAE